MSLNQQLPTEAKAIRDQAIQNYFAKGGTIKKIPIAAAGLRDKVPAEEYKSIIRKNREYRENKTAMQEAFEKAKTNEK